MNRNEFKFTFEDGSESIVHYGVKGMKWGQHLFGKDFDVTGTLRSAAGNAANDIKGGVSKARSILAGELGAGGYAENSESGKTEEKQEEQQQEQVEVKPALTDEQVEALAYSVIEGEWGNGQERYDRLQDEGYSYEKVQTKVNDIIYGTNDYEQGNNTSGREDRVQENQVQVKTEEPKQEKPVEEKTKKKVIG